MTSVAIQLFVGMLLAIAAVAFFVLVMLIAGLNPGFRWL